MITIRITYETLFDLLRREKNREELQSLDKDFYEQVHAYLKEKKDGILRKGDELFASAEREKLKIQFHNIRRIVKELYERREKKIINTALTKARTGSDIIDTSSLLPSEKDFFQEQCALFIKHKEKILSPILEARDVNNNGETIKSQKAEKPVIQTIVKKEGEKEQLVEEPEEKSDDVSEKKVFACSKIRILSSLPKFVGSEGASLGPYEEGEEVELEQPIADLLLKRGVAEPC